MQSTLQIQRQESSQIEMKLSISVDRIEQSISFGPKNGGLPMSPRTRPACTCSNRPGSARCARHGYLVPPGERMKKRPASKEILRRALTPPPRRFAFRSLNFRPTPSRLSQMSMA
ncbi:uncharacterized protein LOC114736302 [Neltuma alba]|uniref:uncharacterized protein LOC114736302 n=1 Tax=Neltuma alba TaxID=207710 RepID=UPI0010A3902F|nr:uncharacterized protein LOC114736302 [Prosopis alba]